MRTAQAIRLGCFYAAADFLHFLVNHVGRVFVLSSTSQERGFSGMESTQEQTWIKQAQSGDQKALALLFHHYYPFLFKYALKLTWSRETAEDFVQETMLKAMTHLSSYNGTSRFSSWLVTIGTRQYFDQIRKCKREKKWIEEEKSMR